MCWVIMGGVVLVWVGYVKVGGNFMFCCEGFFVLVFVLVLFIRGIYLVLFFVFLYGWYVVFSVVVCRYERWVGMGGYKE